MYFVDLKINDEKLQININGYIYHPHYGEINLYQLFPYSFLDFGGQKLFFPNPITLLQGEVVIESYSIYPNYNIEV